MNSDLFYIIIKLGKLGVTTTSTTQFLPLLQHKNNSSACNDVPLYLEWIWNWSFIGQ